MSELLLIPPDILATASAILLKTRLTCVAFSVDDNAGWRWCAVAPRSIIVDVDQMSIYNHTISILPYKIDICLNMF